MHGDDPCAFRRSDSVCEHVFDAAAQHGLNVAKSPPKPANTPPLLVFSDLKARSGIVRQQFGLLQLLQIVAALRSGCVRLTYRILAQVWQKEGVHRSSVHRNERIVSALYATNWAACSVWTPVARRACGNTRGSGQPSGRNRVHCEESFKTPSGRNTVVPTTWGWLQERTWATA